MAPGVQTQLSRCEGGCIVRFVMDLALENGSGEKEVYLPSGKISKNGLNYHAVTRPSSNSFALELQFLVKQLVSPSTPKQAWEHPKNQPWGLEQVPCSGVSRGHPECHYTHPETTRGASRQGDDRAQGTRKENVWATHKYLCII